MNKIAAPDHTLHKTCGDSAADKGNSPRMFDAIASRYDFVNSLISLGLHHSWRKALVGMVPLKPNNLNCVDLATGTGDVAIALANLSQIGSILGIDLSNEMLAQGIKKVKNLGLQSKINLIHGDALDIPCESGSVDLVTISFGIRNVTDPLSCLNQMIRILKPGGTALILESGTPTSPLIRFFNRLYIRHAMPFIGRLYSRHNQAYTYLNQTIESFPSGENFRTLMSQSGFSKTGFKPLMMGSTYIYWGQK